MHKTIQEYIAALAKNDADICKLLQQVISKNLPEAESKIWHKHPVWFLNGNPIVGIAKLKNDIQLLFWSGQTFNEPNLQSEGSFKAAQIRYTLLNQINESDLTRWLEKARQIQWDYKNIVKNRGKLNLLEI